MNNKGQGKIDRQYICTVIIIIFSKNMKVIYGNIQKQQDSVCLED